MRPKLKPDTYWVPIPEGVSFVHPTGHLTIKGQNALPLIDRLSPYLDGTVTLRELVDGLPEGKAEMVTTLVGALSDAGLIKDAGEDRPHGLTEEELSLFASEIAYIDYHTDSAASRFERFRHTPTLCVGSGQTLACLVHAALSCGLRNVTVAVTADEPTERVRVFLDRFDEREHPPRTSVVVLDSPDELGALVSGAGLVLHAADVGGPEHARVIDRLCADSETVSVHGLVVDDQAWVGPAGTADPAGWESMWLRGAAARPLPRHADPFATVTDSPSVFLTGPTASLVANRVAFSGFRHLTGVEEEREPTELRGSADMVNLETLQTTQHRFHPHPGAEPAEEESAEDLASRHAAFLAAEPLPEEEFSVRAATVFDPLLGITTALDEKELAQIPLCVSRVTVSDPFQLLDTTKAHPEVLGYGDDFTQARRSAAYEALAAYAALAVDRRRLPGRGTQAHVVRPSTGEVRTVAAERVHPVLAAPVTGGDFRTPVGLGWGQDPDEALRNGLLQHIIRETVSGLPGEQRFHRVDLDGADLDTAARRYLDLLRFTEIPVEVFDVTGPLGVPVYAFCYAPRVVVHGTDLTAGLRSVLLDYQRIRFDPVPQLPRKQLERRATVPYRDPAGWSVEELVLALEGTGRRVYASPVGHDPVVSSLLPALVQVVLHD